MRAGRYGRIGVLAGGPSSEREISLRSGKAVYEALIGEGVDAILIDVGDDIRDVVERNNLSVAFIALHGRFGEDGTIQSMLEIMGVPYTGSGAEASKLALDKVASKETFIRAGIRVPRYVVIEEGHRDIDRALELGMPLVVKPYLEGSSIGLSVVRQEDELESAVEKAFEYGSKVLIEEFINGRELTVGLFQDKPLPVIEIVTKDNFYDYRAKYSDPETRYLVPAPIEARLAAKAQEIAGLSHRALGCSCISRVDMMMDGSGEIYVLEANTIPGMTERSLLPKAAGAVGLSFGGLCVKLVEDAIERRRKGCSVGKTE